MRPRVSARLLATLIALLAFAAAAVRVPVPLAHAQSLLDAGSASDAVATDSRSADAAAIDSPVDDAASGGDAGNWSAAVDGALPLAQSALAATQGDGGLPAPGAIASNIANTESAGTGGDTLSMQGAAPDDVFGTPRAIAPGLGRLRVVANRPDSRVLLDGREVGFAPCEVDVRPGTYRLRVDSPFQRPWEGNATIRAERLHAFRVFLRPAPNRIGAGVILTLTTLVFGGGITLGILSQADRGALEASRNAGRLDNNDPRISRGATLAWVSDLSFVFGGLLGALGGYFTFADLGAPSIGRMSRRQRLEVSR